MFLWLKCATAGSMSESRLFLYDPWVTCWRLSALGYHCPTQQSLNSIHCSVFDCGKLHLSLYYATSVSHFVTIKLKHWCICLVSAGRWLVMRQSGCHPTLRGHESDHYNDRFLLSVSLSVTHSLDMHSDTRRGVPDTSVRFNFSPPHPIIGNATHMMRDSSRVLSRLVPSDLQRSKRRGTCWQRSWEGLGGASVWFLGTPKGRLIGHWPTVRPSPTPADVLWPVTPSGWA